MVVTNITKMPLEIVDEKGITHYIPPRAKNLPVNIDDEALLPKGVVKVSN